MLEVRHAGDLAPLAGSRLGTIAMAADRPPAIVDAPALRDWANGRGGRMQRLLPLKRVSSSRARRPEKS